jgi:hypothetical protein
MSICRAKKNGGAGLQVGQLGGVGGFTVVYVYRYNAFEDTFLSVRCPSAVKQCLLYNLERTSGKRHVSF